MKVRSRNNRGDGVTSISRLGQKRQLVIPKKVCDRLGIRVGDFVQVSVKDNAAIIKSGKEVDLDDTLTPKEGEMVHEGELQLRRGMYLTLDQLEYELVRKAGRKGRKTIL